MPDAQIYVQDYHVRPEKVRSQSTSAKKHAPKIGDPTPLGLSAFAISVMISALYNLRLFGVQQQNILVGVGLFTGGIVQFTAGMWAFKVGSTFGGTGFSAYGGFWLSYAIIFIPGFGIQSAFGNDLNQFHNAMGIFLLTWLIFTIIFTLACIRTNAGVLSAFVFLTITFLSEVIYNFSPTSDIFIKFAGVTGLITAGIVWYCLAATLLTPDLSPINLPLWDLSRKDH